MYSSSHMDLRQVPSERYHIPTSNYGTYRRQGKQNSGTDRGNISSSQGGGAPSNPKLRSPFFKTPPSDTTSPPTDQYTKNSELHSRSYVSNVPLASKTFQSTTNIPNYRYQNHTRQPPLPSAHKKTHVTKITHASSLNLTNMYEDPQPIIIPSDEEPTQLRYFKDEDSEASDGDTDELTKEGVCEDPTPRLRQLERANHELRISLAQSKLTVGTLSSELSRGQFHITELNTQLKESGAKHADLVTKLKSVTIRCIQAERQVQDLSQRSSDLNQQLGRVEDENERLGEENDRLTQEVRNLRAQQAARASNNSEDGGGWDDVMHRQQIRERSNYASQQLDKAVADAQEGIRALLRGVEGVSQVSNILSTLDKFYAQPQSQPSSPENDMKNSPHHPPDSPFSNI